MTKRFVALVLATFMIVSSNVSAMSNVGAVRAQEEIATFMLAAKDAGLSEEQVVQAIAQHLDIKALTLSERLSDKKHLIAASIVTIVVGGLVLYKFWPTSEVVVEKPVDEAGVLIPVKVIVPPVDPILEGAVFVGDVRVGGDFEIPLVPDIADGAAGGIIPPAEGGFRFIPGIDGADIGLPPVAEDLPEAGDEIPVGSTPSKASLRSPSKYDLRKKVQSPKRYGFTSTRK